MKHEYLKQSEYKKITGSNLFDMAAEHFEKISEHVIINIKLNQLIYADAYGTSVTIISKLN